MPSGGVNAGLFLSHQIALFSDVEIEVAIMAGGLAERKWGPLKILHFPCSMRACSRCSRFIPSQLQSLLWRSPLISQYILESRPDIVHFHNPFPPGALRQLSRTCKKIDIPYVISGHGFIEMTAFSSSAGLALWKRPLAQVFVTRPFYYSVRNAAHVFITSPFERDSVVSMGVAEHRQSIITNGVNPFFLMPAETELCKSVSERFEIYPDVPSFLFVGNHTVNKGIDVLLESAHLIEVPVRIVVGGRIRSQIEHDRMCRKHHLADIRKRVVFTDTLSNRELRALYQSVSAFVFPSKSDTLPLVILEAMASGLPVIASSIGGIPYQVTKETGILVPPGDAGDLARGITKLATDGELCKRMGKAGRDRVIKNFDWKKSAQYAVESYYKVLDN